MILLNSLGCFADQNLVAAFVNSLAACKVTKPAWTFFFVSVLSMFIRFRMFIRFLISAGFLMPIYVLTSIVVLLQVSVPKWPPCFCSSFAGITAILHCVLSAS